jgi:hypothetical protein
MSASTDFPTTDLLERDQPSFVSAYNRGYEHGYGTAEMKLGGIDRARRDRRIATAWFVVGLVAGVWASGVLL